MKKPNKKQLKELKELIDSIFKIDCNMDRLLPLVQALGFEEVRETFEAEKQFVKDIQRKTRKKAEEKWMKKLLYLIEIIALVIIFVEVMILLGYILY